MKLVTKIYILGIVLCLVGAILGDLNILVTAWVCGLLGSLVLLVGPLAAEIMEDDK